jgi:hypothetical protein
MPTEDMFKSDETTYEYHINKCEIKDETLFVDTLNDLLEPEWPQYAHHKGDCLIVKTGNGKINLWDELILRGVIKS